MLALHYRPHATVLTGCLLGTLRGDTVRVERIAPSDVDPVHSTPTHVLPKQICEEAGWYPVDAILCSSRVVWISRDMVERQLEVEVGRMADSTGGDI